MRSFTAAAAAAALLAALLSGARTSPRPIDTTEVSRAVDEKLRTAWARDGLTSAPPASPLTVLRRLSLALHGTIPSLEEIRSFEADARPDKLDRWTAKMLSEPRFARYFAERLARSFVGVDGGKFLVYRRDRFVDWVEEQLTKNTPYDEIVRALITATGLWTSSGQSNFITQAKDADVLEDRLAGRTARVFLGQRIDCAQCHDHPFDDWTQDDFRGLAAHYAPVKLGLFGVEDHLDRTYIVDDPKSETSTTIAPTTPFHAEWLSDAPSPRARLAAWITNENNRRFQRATANRVFGLMFGIPLTAVVDEIPDPSNTEDVLDLLGRDFAAHGHDLRRLITAITKTEAFRRSSIHPAGDFGQRRAAAEAWASFPLVRLRPEQVIGAMIQAGSINTIDQKSHLVVRTIRFLRENNFVNEYGDPGESELERLPSTIPQVLLAMNGKLAKELSDAHPFSSAGRIAIFSGSDAHLVETAFLVALTRRPTVDEHTHFGAQLDGTEGDARAEVTSDLFWSLFNSAEFSWNH